MIHLIHYTIVVEVDEKWSICGNVYITHEVQQFVNDFINLHGSPSIFPILP